MNLLSRFVLTIAVSVLAGFLLMRLRVPLGALLGAMFATMLMNLAFENAYFYPSVRVAVQMMTGMMVASRIGREDLKEMKKVLYPSFLLVIGMLFFNLVFGYVVYRISPLDVPTSLFAFVPGGMSDMAMIASDFGADTAYVAILQMLRLVYIMIVLPPAFRIIIKRTGRRPIHVIHRTKMPSAKPAVNAEGSAKESSHAELPTEPFRYSRRERLLLVGLVGSAIVGGLLLRRLGIPAGAMTGSMLFGIAYSVIADKSVYPHSARFTQQILAGAAIGSGIGRETIRSLGVLLMPVLVMIAGITVLVLLLSWLVHKLTKLPFTTAMLACTPGGIAEISMLSEELGEDTAKIAVIQTIRVVVVVLLFPSMLALILHAA